jgi:heme ABC exporter ATP-binding subunit CcmA
MAGGGARTIDVEPRPRGLFPEAARERRSAVSLRGVTRVFGSFPALIGVHLDVPSGETMLVRGPNGAGKSTLLRLIATVLRPTFGNGSVLGHDLWTDASSIRSRTEWLGHRTRFYDDLTGAENLRFACELHGADPARLGPALARVGLTRAADSAVRAYSHGMRQRLALGRLLLRDPELLLLDEPYAGLDEDGKDLVDDIVRDAHRRGRTVVVATHERERAGIATTIAAMDGGRLVAEATDR